MAGLFSIHMDLKLASLMLIVLLLFTLVRLPVIVPLLRTYLPT